MRTLVKKTILKSFEATDIVPFNPNKILGRITPDEPHTPFGSSVTSCYSGDDWRHTDRTLRRCVKDPNTKDARALRRTFHHLSVDYQLLRVESKGLREACKVKKKQGKKAKTLPLIQQKETRATTRWWSPSKVSEARWRDKVFTRESRGRESQESGAQKVQHTTQG